MLKIGQNWGKIANYPPNAQQRLAPLVVEKALTVGNNAPDLIGSRIEL